VEAEMFHQDGQTDRETDITKLIVSYRNFTNAPKNRFLPQFKRNTQIHCVDKTQSFNV